MRSRPLPITLTHSDVVAATGVKRIEAWEVPLPPRSVIEGVVDEGPHRWRFDKHGKLIAYIEYGDGGNPSPDWKRAWTASPAAVSLLRTVKPDY